ncbi:MAG: DUF3037 domain-containing protein [Parafilimonas sp.]|nr:DUF3037 domain-containing protein [Parafilimonas sp.]
MQEKQLFEYAVIRIVPRVDRQEFFNVGIILYCASLNFLQVKFEINQKKMAAFSKEIDTEDLQKRLHAFEQICAGDKIAGEIALLPLPSRFRWLTARRSTILQTSPVHPGFSNNLIQTLDKLFNELVK